MVFDIQRFSIHDGPGIRTTVFFKGCPLSCWWCHNPESQAMERELVYQSHRCIRCGACVAACEHGALSWTDDAPSTDHESCAVCGSCAEVCASEARQIVGREMTAAEVMAEVERDVVFYDQSGGGVTFSGGEPLYQPQFLLGLLRACKAVDIHTAVDTCGFSAWETCARIADETDLFLYDLKLMDDGRHREFTGVSNELILQNLRRLSERGQSIVLRVPIIPGINDDEENLRQIAAHAADLPHLRQIDLLPYHSTAADKYRRLNREYELRDIRPPGEDRLAEIKAILEGGTKQARVSVGTVPSRQRGVQAPVGAPALEVRIGG